MLRRKALFALFVMPALILAPTASEARTVEECGQNATFDWKESTAPEYPATTLFEEHVALKHCDIDRPNPKNFLRAVLGETGCPRGSYVFDFYTRQAPQQFFQLERTAREELDRRFEDGYGPNLQPDGTLTKASFCEDAKRRHEELAQCTSNFKACRALFVKGELDD
ncbi:MAG: hypothetical protein AAFW47_08540, partial [Pseudomonadota bacterium]